MVLVKLQQLPNSDFAVKRNRRTKRNRVSGVRRRGWRVEKEGGFIYAYENIQVSIKNRDLSTLGCENRTSPEKIYVFIHAATDGKRWSIKEKESERGGEWKRKNSSEKSVCFFTALDFIFESIFFAPTVTHC